MGPRRSEKVGQQRDIFSPVRWASLWRVATLKSSHGASCKASEFRKKSCIANQVIAAKLRRLPL